MKYVNVSARVPFDDKLAFEIFCEQLGINVSVAMNMFIKAALRENRIPFELYSDEPFYSASNMKHLANSIKEKEEGRVVIKTMKELEDMENE